MQVRLTDRGDDVISGDDDDFGEDEEVFSYDGDSYEDVSCFV